MKKLPEYRWMSLWRHFYDRERTVDELTGSMIEWQKKWNWDLLKVNPPACYHVLDWGADYHFFKDPMREPELIHPAIQQKEDFQAIKPLDVTRGVLGDQLEVIRNLRHEFAQLPIVETIFSPIEIAHRLMKSRSELKGWIEEDPDLVQALLTTIGDTFLRFAVECLKAGADGVFFATKWATSDSLTWEQYEQFGKAHELPLLTALQQRDALLILHVCGDRTYLSKMLDYPADILSWDFFADGSIAPQEAVSRSGKFVLGGVDPNRLRDDPASVIEQCRSLQSLERWLIGPSCVVTADTPDESIRQLKQRLS